MSNKQNTQVENNQSNNYYYIAPLNGFSAEDMTLCVSDINTYLTSIGKDLNSISQNVAVPVNGNLFASVSASGKLLEILSGSQDKESYSALTIDLISCISGEDATTVTVLRPILHKIRDSYLRQDKQSISILKASDLKLFVDHQNTLLAGTLKRLIIEAQGKLPDWLDQSILLAESTLDSLLVDSISQPSSSISNVSSSNSKNWYDPKNSYPSLWAALYAVTQEQNERMGEFLQKPTELSSVSQQNLSQSVLALKTNLSKEIKAQSSQKTGNIDYFFKLLLDILKDDADILKTTAIVEGQPARIVEEKKEGIFEALAQVQPANSCAGGCEGDCNTRVGGSIGLALGEECIEQVDFTLSGAMPLVWGRTYRSNLITYDKGSLGSRWTNEYLSRIDIRKNEWLFNTNDGRIIKLPKLKIKDSYYHPIEKFRLVFLDENTISITYSRDLLELYQKQGTHYKLVLVKNHNHHDISLSYDAGHKLISVVNHANNHCLYLEYNKNSQIIQVQLHHYDNESRTIGDLLRTVAQYQYDQNNNLISATDEHNDTRSFQYDNYHRLIRYTDRTGFGMNLEWSGRRHKAKVIKEYQDNGSGLLHLNWLNGLRATTVTNALSQTTHNFYDINGSPIRKIYPDGKEEWIFRDSHQNIVKKIHADGRATSYQYDHLDNLISITANDSSKTFFEHNEAGQLVRITDANGHQWRKQYDTKGNIVKEFDPKEQVTLYEYNELGKPISITNAKGGITSFEYNTSGQLLKQTDCSNQSTEYQYDEQGRLVSIKNAENQITKYQYNQRGQRIKTIYPDGKYIQNQYDAEGRILNSSDQSGRNHQTQYDDGFMPFLMTDTLGRKTAYKRDVIGKTIQLTNAIGANYHWQYHPQTNQLVKETSFTGKTTQYSYDEQTGELYKSQEIGSNPVYYEYDEAGRLSKRYTDTQFEEFTYDQKGQLILTKNQHSQIQYFYDELGNLVKEIQDILRSNDENPEQSTAIRRFVWQHQYDALGNKTVTIRPDGQQIDYLYYGSGHLHGILLNQISLVDYERNNLHQEITKIYGNKLVQQRQYDATGYLIKQKLEGKQTSEKNYTYNKEGYIRQIKHAHNSQQKNIQQYEYDLAGRLIHSRNNTNEENFSYDPADNRLFDDVAESANNQHTKSYNLENRFPNSYAHTDYRIHADKNYKKNQYKNNSLLNKVGENQYQYDERGNLIKKITTNNTTTTFEWNDFNQLIKISNQNNNTYYLYDPFGRRITKQVEYKNTATSVFANPTKIETYYSWEGDTLAMEETNDELIHYLYEIDSSAPLTQIHTDKNYQIQNVYFYHNDHIGTPEFMTNETGDIVWEKLDNTAFGSTTAQSRESTLKNPIRFQGQYYDEESGLHYNRFRYYESETGKYLSEDPIKLAGGMNLYNYPTNPVHLFDPMGLAAVAAGAPILMGAGEGAAALCSTGVGCAVVAVAASGVVGVYAGTKINQATGASDYLADAMWYISGNSAKEKYREQAEAEKDADHQRYHNNCDRPDPSDLLPCDLARWRYKKALKCQKLRQEWEDRWGNSQSKAPHQRALANVKRQLKNAADEIKSLC